MRGYRLAHRLLLHPAVSLLMAVLLVLPDYLFRLLRPTYQAQFETKTFATIWVIAALMLGLRARGATLALLLFLALLQLSQFLHFAYYGSLISPHEVVFLLSESGEVWQSLYAVLPFMAWPLAIVAGCALAAWLLWKRAHGHVLAMPYVAAALLCLLFAILPVKAYKKPRSQDYYPSPAAYSLRNTLYAVSYSVGRGLRGGSETPRPGFLPYRVEPLPLDEPPNIVIVMGESLTHRHMSLFGYARETTPELDKLRDDPNFVHLRAISAGVATKTALPAFFNIQREPGNIDHLLRYDSNLLKLAKQRGYRTWYVSAQTANLATYAGTEFADEFVTQEEMGDLYERLKDDVLLHYLEGVDLSRPAFVILHQRNSHSPYEQSHPPEYAKWPIDGVSQHDYTVNSYDNSIRYTDHLLVRILDRLRQRSKRPTYLFFTSDHGEMMGEHGKYSHMQLEPDVARVPFLLYSLGGDPAFVERVRTLRAPGHYDIGRAIAEALGYRLINPNERPDLVYLAGTDLGNEMGCLAIARDEQAEDGWKTVADPLCAPSAGGAD